MRELKIIESVEGDGYVLVSEHWETEDRKETDYKPIQDTAGEENCMKRMLLAVADHFGFEYDRFGKNNINITFGIKGHKIE